MLKPTVRVHRQAHVCRNPSQHALCVAEPLAPGTRLWKKSSPGTLHRIAIWNEFRTCLLGGWWAGGLHTLSMYKAMYHTQRIVSYNSM